ncbi:MAG TPA: hypothetical protein VEW28_00865 [Candidatus Kapabacteria bacterium]|nr:hypothetical protein [Candidatus Kapabacteria bacterium]
MKLFLLISIVTIAVGCSKTTANKPATQTSGNSIHSNPPIKQSGVFYFSEEDNLFRYDTDRDSLSFVFKGYDASVSPDEQLVACTQENSTPDKSDWTRVIAITDLTTKKTTVLSSLPGIHNVQPQFSPDSKTIIFDHYDSTSKDWNICSCSVNGSDFRFITKGHNSTIYGYYMQSWLADGSGFICHNLDTAFEFTTDGKVALSYAMKDIAPVDEYDVSSGSGIFSDHAHHRIVIEAGSDEEEGVIPEHYAVFIYDTQTKQTRMLTPKGMHSWDPHWVESKQRFFFRGYQTTEMMEAEQMGGDIRINWTMYSVKADGNDLKEEFTRNKLKKVALISQ